MINARKPQAAGRFTRMRIYYVFAANSLYTQLRRTNLDTVPIEDRVDYKIAINMQLISKYLLLFHGQRTKCNGIVW